MGAPRKNIRIGIADMHHGAMEATAFWLEARPRLKVALKAGSIPVLMHLLKSKTVDVLLLELAMPCEEGMEPMAELKQQYPDMKILIYSIYNREQLMGLAMQYGANGYLCKTCCMEELETAIRKVAEEEIYCTHEVFLAMQKKMISNDHEARLTGPFAGFKRTELECLRLTCLGFSQKEIAERMFKSIDAVKGYRKGLRRKTRCTSLAGLIAWGQARGLATAKEPA